MRRGLEMALTEPYNERVRSLFANPAHAGDLRPRAGERRTAQAGSPAAGAEIRLAAVVENGTVVEMRFRAFGCPHLVAAAEWLCREMEGQPLEALGKVDWAEMRTILAAPVEKTGRLLLLEDAAALLRKGKQGHS